VKQIEGVSILNILLGNFRGEIKGCANLVELVVVPATSGKRREISDQDRLKKTSSELTSEARDPGTRRCEERDR